MVAILEYRYEGQTEWRIVQKENDVALIEDSYVWDLIRDNDNKVVRIREE